MRTLGLAFLSAILLVLAPSPATAQSAAPSLEPGAPAPALFLREAALRLGAPAEDVTLGAIEGPILLPDAGLTLFVASATLGDRAKVLVALTTHGEIVDYALALAVDAALGHAARGKLTLRLAEELTARGPAEVLPVVAWLAGAEDAGEIRLAIARSDVELDELGLLTRALAESGRAELDARLAQRVGSLTAQAAARWQAAGFAVTGRDDYAPLVFLRADLADLQRLAADPQVASLDWAGTEYVDRLNVGVAEVRAHSVWTAPGGVTGVGAKVSIVESTRVCSSNPYMTVAATKNAAGAVGSHTTGVGSCVASTHATYKGVAPGATLISANGADFTASSTNVTTQLPGSVSAVSWSVSQGAHVMNLSYGAGAPGATVSSFDKYLDWIARNNGRTVVPAAGNSGNYAGDPGAGFNQLAVGAFNDAGGSAWSGETMASFSSWRNPSTGLETPMVAAPGVGITMLTCSSPWTGYTADGTSFSAPITAGAAALVVSKQPALGTWQEAVRAIVMATAWHNIEGAAALSSKDGAGGIDALAAFRVAGRGKGVGYNYGTLTSASFNGTGYYTAQTGSATAGQTVRVALCFDSTPSAGPTYSPDTLKADLDLYVYNPNGTLAASATSGNQPNEIVHFTASASGTYTVKIRKYSWTGSSEYFGTAFSTSADQ